MKKNKGDSKWKYLVRADYWALRSSKLKADLLYLNHTAEIKKLIYADIPPSVEQDKGVRSRVAVQFAILNIKVCELNVFGLTDGDSHVHHNRRQEEFKYQGYLKLQRILIHTFYFLHHQVCK